MSRRKNVMNPGLMLDDLVAREPVAEKLLSVRLPIDLLDRLDAAALTLRTRKGEIVVAMLNEGLARFAVNGNGNGRSQKRARKA